MTTEKSTFRETLASMRYMLANTWRVDKRIVPLYLLSALLKVVSPFIAIFLPKLIIDALTGSQADLAAVLQLLTIFTISLIAINTITQAADNFLNNKAFMVRTGASVDIQIKTMSMDYDTLESPVGQTVRQKALTAVYNQNAGTQSFVPDLANLFAHAAGLILYAFITAELNLMIVVALFAASILNYCAVRAAQNYEAKHRDQVAVVEKKLTYLRETALDYHGGKDLRLYSMTDWFDHLYQGYIDEYLAMLGRFFKRHFSADALATVLDLVRDGFAYIYLISLVVARQISIGDFTLYFAAIAGIANWVTLIVSDITSLQRGCREIGYLRAFLAIPERVVENPLPTCAETPEIIFENVSFRYPGSDTWTLRNFNLTIRAGEKLALVGINGAGKTTCVKLLTGLYQPTKGRILWDGRDISHFEPNEYFKLFSVVFQEVTPLAMSLRQNVALKPYAEIDEDRVKNCLELAGLSAKTEELKNGLDTQLTRFLYEDGVELSGGQAQKMMLARALYKDAPVVLMDEPTAALDPIAEAEMYERYDQMVGHKTSLYISHRLASTRFCDRIAFLENGMLTELGSHGELMASGGKYAAMYAVQSQYYQENFEGGENHDQQ